MKIQKDYLQISEKCNRLKETMQRTHERKLETFYHLENLDLEKDKIVILRSNVERQLAQGRKRKRKRKRHSKKKTEGLSDEELEIKLENVTEEVKESILREKPAFEIPEKLCTPLNNVDYELPEPEISLLSKGSSFCPTPFNVNWPKAVESGRIKFVENGFSMN